MKKDKYKILVLSDLNKSASTILKNAVSLSKMINGEIHFLCVKRPSEIVQKESQLSAFRTINEEHFNTKKEILKVITPISKAHDIAINHTISVGNVKSEIGDFIKEFQPDIIVLGKRNPKKMKLIGDSITQFVLKKYDGTIMISADKNAFEPNEKLILGVLNKAEASFNLAFEKDLMSHTNMPLQSFKIIKKSNELSGTKKELDKNVVEYVFEQNDNTTKTLSNYMLKNKVNLLCLNRTKTAERKPKQITAEINNAINNLNISLLLSGIEPLNHNSN